MRRLNVKLLLGLLIGTAVTVAVLFVVHWFQTDSIGRALLARAERAEEKQEYRQAVRYVSRYLELKPDDLEARAHLGHVLATELATTPKARTQAVFVIEQVLLKDSQRHDLRLKLVRLALDLDRQELAQQHLRVLQGAMKDSAEVEHQQAQLAVLQKNWPEAAVWYRKAVQHNPQQLDSAVHLADLLRRRFGPDKEGTYAHEADQVIDSLVEANADNATAHLARWRYRKQWAGIEEAKNTAAANVATALRLAPEQADALLAAAELAQAMKDNDAARQHLQHGRKLHPHDVRMHRELAMLELRLNRRTEAVACLREGARALTGQARSDILWTLGNVLIDIGDLTEARSVVTQMTKNRATAVAIDYLNARLHIQEANWSEATRLLERTRPLVANLPELSTQVDFLLAQCFEQLDDPAARLSALGRIITRDPTSVAARSSMGAALASAGRLDDALEQYRQLMALPTAPAGGWTEVARLMLFRELQRQQRERTADAPRKPKRGGNWKPVEEALDRATAADPGSVDVVLLRAEVLVAQDKVDEARQLLAGSLEKNKEAVKIYAAMASLHVLDEQNKDLDGAAALLEQARQQAGDTLELRHVQVQFWTRQGGDKALAALSRIAKDVNKFSPRDQSRLLSAIAVACYRLGETKDAARIWNQLAQEPQNKNDLRLRLLLFDLALQGNDDAAMQRVVKELKGIEGEQGTLWRYAAAVRLTARARSGDRGGLAEARTLLDAVAARRPEWPNVLVAKAGLEEVSNNFEQAITEYRRAISLGEHSPRVVRQLVQLLYKQQRYEEADKEVRQLEKQTTNPLETQKLQRLAVDISLQNQDPDRAVKLAQAAVAADSKDYRDRLWQGQVLAASGIQDEQAEKELRQAVELGDTVSETWIALVQFLARKNRLTDAETAIDQAKTKLPADQAPLALAICYESIGKRDLAGQHYEKALAAQPKDVALHSTVAGFYIRTGQMTLAEPALRKIIDRQVEAGARDIAWARRSLALALATRSDARRLPEALALVGLRLESDGRVVETAVPSADDSADEHRVRAHVLAALPWRAPRKQAIALFEDLNNRRALPADDQFMLAQLYEADDNWAKAREQLRVLTNPVKNPAYLAHYAQSLLRRRDYTEADRCIGRLEQLEKSRRLEVNSLGSIELRALLLEAKGEGDKALTLLRGLTERRQAKPEATFLLVSSLARQRKYAEALALCEQARATCPVELVAGTTMALLREAKAADDICGRFEQWLKDQCAKNPKSARLWLHLADLSDLRGRYEEAETQCRKVLELEPHNRLALNNLAWLLAQRNGAGDEALTLINRAIDVAGPRAELLDTRASVHMARQRGDLALKDMEAALADNPTPPRYFHLAQAHRLTNNAKQAAEALQKATSAGLTRPEQLHPQERAAYSKLVRELEQR